MSVTSAASRPISSTAARIAVVAARDPGIHEHDRLAEKDGRPSYDVGQVIDAVADLLHVALLGSMEGVPLIGLDARVAVDAP